MNNNETLKDPFSFTNKAHTKQSGLRNPNAYGEVKKTNRKNQSKKKLIKGMVYLGVGVGMISFFALANNAYNQICIENGYKEVIASYSPSGGPETKLVDENGNEVNISFSDVLETITDKLENENTMKR